MSLQDDLNNLLNSIADDVDGFIGGSIVDLDTGMSMASISRRPDFDLDVASAYNSEMVKAKLKTISALNISSNLEDMLLTLTDQLHLIRMLDNNRFVYIAVARESTNLALLRSVVNSHARVLG
ncbi:Uncharacterised protein [Corynebacterium renale]|uniref:Uncharacterized protein n=1 Tax=Corynebacterium renale TaxID=1724 RepID=A0A2A9DNG4_9CORY|nr:hypothetical protein [Corynebacterium renale]PFG28144.1 hypothetical protein ATK06_1239 [Corynebacterium renale]SQG65265.1 Uncharacterised protein [Corynebacterium renale]SQI20377.1 Uncharacterised protein [Corynebacterium renale]STC98544.1 Uncharacterised protein [Corynebacterium renale]